MKNKEEFIEIIDSKFFNHLIKNSLISFWTNPNRIDFLNTVYDNLLSSISGYKPKKPRKYISHPKSRYVIRMVPTFELSDYCIYYYCIKSIEEFIAINRVEWTFWWFRLWWILRENENTEFIESDFSDSINENSFNAFAWKKEYWEYQAKLKEYALKVWGDYKFCVQIDISNFYDAIRLDLLYNKILTAIPSWSYRDEILLLFNLLKFWNTHFDSEKTIGIPQDEVWDCSRILSNFFLQDYDNYIYSICSLKNAKYIRYADDQIFFTQSKEDAEEILYLASHKLFEEWFNINSGKTKEFSTYEAINNFYWFSIFEKLSFEWQDVNSAFELLEEKILTWVPIRISSILKRLLHKKINLENLSQRNRLKLVNHLWNEDFLLFSNAHYMWRIHWMLNSNEEKEEFIANLEKIFNKTKFESFKINYLKFKNLS